MRSQKKLPYGQSCCSSFAWSKFDVEEGEFARAEELDGSGIWDTPYVIDDAVQDTYPLMEVIPEFPAFIILPLFMIATLLAVIVYKKRV